MKILLEESQEYLAGAQMLHVLSAPYGFRFYSIKSNGRESLDEAEAEPLA